jgi:hypothetical protein
MNLRQRIVVFIGAVIIAAMLAFPPMQGWYTGYASFFSPRSTYRAELVKWESDNVYDNGWRYWHIDQERLKYQLVIAAVLTLGVTVLLGTRRKS